MKLFAFLFAFGAAQDFSKFEKLAGDLDNFIKSATEGIEQVQFIFNGVFKCIFVVQRRYQSPRRVQ